MYYPVCNVMRWAALSLFRQIKSAAKSALYPQPFTLFLKLLSSYYCIVWYILCYYGITWYYIVSFVSCGIQFHCTMLTSARGLCLYFLHKFCFRTKTDVIFRGKILMERGEKQKGEEPVFSSDFQRKRLLAKVLPSQLHSLLLTLPLILHFLGTRGPLIQGDF